MLQNQFYSIHVLYDNRSIIDEVFDEKLNIQCQGWTYHSLLLAFLTEYIRIVNPLNISKKGIFVSNFDRNSTVNLLLNNLEDKNENFTQKIISQNDLMSSIDSIDQNLEICLKSLLNQLQIISYPFYNDIIDNCLPKSILKTNEIESLIIIFTTEDLIDKFKTQIVDINDKIDEKLKFDSSNQTHIVLLSFTSNLENNFEKIYSSSNCDIRVNFIKFSLIENNFGDFRSNNQHSNSSLWTSKISSNLQDQFHRFIINLHKLDLGLISGIPMKEERFTSATNVSANILPQSQKKSNFVATKNDNSSNKNLNIIPKVYNIGIVITKQRFYHKMPFDNSMNKNVNIDHDNNINKHKLLEKNDSEIKNFKWCGTNVSWEDLIKANNVQYFNYLEPFKRQSQCLLNFLISGKIVAVSDIYDQINIILTHNGCMAIFKVDQHNYTDKTISTYLNSLNDYNNGEKNLMKYIMKLYDKDLSLRESPKNLEIYHNVTKILFGAIQVNICSYKHAKLILQFFDSYFEMIISSSDSVSPSFANEMIKTMENSCIQLLSIVLSSKSSHLLSNDSKNTTRDQTDFIIGKVDELIDLFMSFDTKLCSKYIKESSLLDSIKRLFILMNDSLISWKDHIHSLLGPLDNQSISTTMKSSNQNLNEGQFNNIGFDNIQSNSNNKFMNLSHSFNENINRQININRIENYNNNNDDDIDKSSILSSKHTINIYDGDFSQKSNIKYINKDLKSYIPSFREDVPILQMWFERNNSLAENTIRPLAGKSLYKDENNNNLI